MLSLGSASYCIKGKLQFVLTPQATPSDRVRCVCRIALQRRKGAVGACTVNSERRWRHKILVIGNTMKGPSPAYPEAVKSVFEFLSPCFPAVEHDLREPICFQHFPVHQAVNLLPI